MFAKSSVIIKYPLSFFEREYLINRFTPVPVFTTIVLIAKIEVHLHSLLGVANTCRTVVYMGRNHHRHGSACSGPTTNPSHSRHELPTTAQFRHHMASTKNPCSSVETVPKLGPYLPDVSDKDLVTLCFSMYHINPCIIAEGVYV